jgi:alpha-galactosidase
LPTVGDTIGPGGVFRLIRTQPILQQIADNLREVAPHAWVLNYSNPMAMNMLALAAAGHTRSVGLCHSIQYTYQELACWCGVPESDLDRVRYTAGGINHVNFYLTLEYQGRNLYDELLANQEALIAAHPEERVRFELLEYLGYWPAEGPHHQSEYYPWFRKNPAAVDYYGLDTLFGYHTDMRINEELEAEVDQQIQAGRINEWERSMEYGAYIINALEGGAPQLFYGNVPNADLITNLPRHAVVEVPCLAEANGIFPCHVGEVPPQLAAVQTPHIAVHQLALAGVQARSRRLIRQAIQADPLTGAILTLAQTREMVDELFAANADYTAAWPRE